MPADVRFEAMGSTAQVVVVGGRRGLADLARLRVAELEARWTRFHAGSEVSRLNALPGRFVIVSRDTFTLVDRAVAAWSLTGGAYDPTVLPALRAAGYDRDFRALSPPAAHPVDRDDGADGEPRVTTASPGCAGIRLHPDLDAVTLPPGVEIDPGGIGKGLAADLVTAELLEEGAAGALVNLGGDLRVRGEPPEGDAWSIAVEHPCRPGRDLFRVALADGAVATSSRLRRQWTAHGHRAHHLIDPRTGAPTVTPLAAVTVVASEGWWAEAATKSVFVSGAGSPPAGTLVATVRADGAVEMSPELEACV